jgi:hypothetical protein
LIRYFEQAINLDRAQASFKVIFVDKNCEIIEFVRNSAKFGQKGFGLPDALI